MLCLNFSHLSGQRDCEGKQINVSVDARFWFPFQANNKKRQTFKVKSLLESPVILLRENCTIVIPSTKKAKALSTF